MIGQRDFTHVNATQSAAAEAQNLQSYAVLPALRIAVHVTLLFERAQDVAGGTLWNFQFAADLGVAQAIRLLGYRFQHGRARVRRLRKENRLWESAPNRYGSKP